MRIAITGANGFLASNLIPCLLNQGHTIHAQVRQMKTEPSIQHPCLSYFEGQLSDHNFLEDVLKGCDTVIHVAAKTSQDGLTLAEYHQVNVELSVELCRVSIDMNVKQFIFVSSSNTLFHGNRESSGNEKQAYAKPFSKSFYAQSKFLAEKELTKLKHQINLNIVHPTFILGPNDPGSSSGRWIRMLVKSRIWFCPPGSKNIVHVKDVCWGIAQLLILGRTGENYLLAGENCTYHQIYEAVKVNCPLPQRWIFHVPKSMVLFLGIVGEALRRMGVKTELSWVNAEILCTRVDFSHEKAKAELEMEFTNMQKVVSEAVIWHSE